MSIIQTLLFGLHYPLFKVKGLFRTSSNTEPARFALEVELLEAAARESASSTNFVNIPPANILSDTVKF